MNDTYVKTIDAEPAAVARQLLRMDAYRELAAGLGDDVASSISVTAALEGTAVAIRIEPHESGDALERWPAVAARARHLVRALLAELAERANGRGAPALAA